MGGLESRLPLGRTNGICAAERQLGGVPLGIGIDLRVSPFAERSGKVFGLAVRPRCVERYGYGGQRGAGRQR